MSLSTAVAATASSLAAFLVLVCGCLVAFIVKQSKNNFALVTDLKAALQNSQQAVQFLAQKEKKDGFPTPDKQRKNNSRPQPPAK